MPACRPVMLSLPPLPRRSRALVLVLAVALWFAATLGLLHRTVHVPGLAVAVVQQAPEGHLHHGIADLFAAHHNEADCRLYDQLSHGSAAPSVPLLALPVFLPAATFAWFEGEVLARWVALFDARGPPSAR